VDLTSSTISFVSKNQILTVKYQLYLIGSIIVQASAPILSHWFRNRQQRKAKLTDKLPARIVFKLSIYLDPVQGQGRQAAPLAAKAVTRTPL
jgi:hypothetical protein